MKIARANLEPNYARPHGHDLQNDKNLLAKADIGNMVSLCI